MGVVIATSLFALTSSVTSFPLQGEDRKDTGKPINYPEASIPKKDEQLKSALKLKPLKERGMHVAAKRKIAEYLFFRPYLAYRLVELFGATPVSMEKMEQGNEWDVSLGSGGSYVFEIVWTGKDRALLKYSYFYRAGIGIGIKFSGSGAVLIRLRPDLEEENAAYIDFDLFVKPGDLPLDKLLQATQIHREWIRRDFKTMTHAFIELCKTVDDDPESVAEDMAEADDLFNKMEVKDFRKTIVAGEKSGMK